MKSERRFWRRRRFRRQSHQTGNRERWRRAWSRSWTRELPDCATDEDCMMSPFVFPASWRSERENLSFKSFMSDDVAAKFMWL